MTTYVNPPKKCDICQANIINTFYDARTHSGRWGNLCPQCFQDHGVGLGTGSGQKYVRQAAPDNSFIKEEG